MSSREKIVDLFHKYWLVALIIVYLLFALSKSVLPAQAVTVLRMVLAVCVWFIGLALCRLCLDGIRRIHGRERTVSAAGCGRLSGDTLMLLSLAGTMAFLIVVMITAPLAHFTGTHSLAMIAVFAGIGALLTLVIHTLLVLRSSSKLIKETEARVARTSSRGFSARRSAGQDI